MGSFNFQDMSVVQDGYYWQNPLYAGVQLSVPLFAGLTKMNRSRELKNQLAQIGEQRDYLRRQIDVQVRSALNDLVTARETMFARGTDCRTSAQGLRHFGYPLSGGRRNHPRTQFGPVGADAGTAELLAGDLRLSDGQSRIRPDCGTRKIEKENIFYEKVFLALVVLASCSCGGNRKAAPVVTETGVLTKTAPATEASVRLTESFTSEIEPFKENDITPAASGVHIDRILVDVGDRVQQGQLLATLDPTQYNQQLVQLRTIENDYNRLLPRLRGRRYLQAADRPSQSAVGCSARGCR